MMGDPGVADVPSGSERVVAVVVDANAMGHGELRLDALRDWARMLALIDIELWVPEPVAWEWAEHAAAEHASLRATLRKAARRLGDAGVATPAWEERSRDAVGEECMAALKAAHSNVHVIPLAADDARESLRDQVLLRPPAKRKNPKEGKDTGVKTGGSDIACVRSVVRHAKGRMYVVLGDDSDWRVAFRLHAPRFPDFYPTWPSLRDELFTLVSAVGEAPAVIAFVASAVARGELGLVGDVRGASALTDGWDGGEPAVHSVDPERLVAIAGVSGVQRVEETDELLAHVYILADVALTTQRYDPTDDGWTATTANYVDVLLEGDILCKIEADIIVSAVADPDGAFDVVAHERYSEPDDAFEAVLAALRSVPGLEQLDWPEAYDQGHPQWVGATSNGARVLLDIDPGPHAEWEMQAAVGNSAEIAIACRYDDTTWVGGSEGMYMEPPWEVVLPSTWSTNPTWRFVADVIAAAQLAG